MPTYEYFCSRCGNRFDFFQNITSEPLRQCPKCHGEVKRLFGQGGGIIFKGTGFYTTDYRSREYKKREKEDKNLKRGEKNEGDREVASS